MIRPCKTSGSLSSTNSTIITVEVVIFQWKLGRRRLKSTQIMTTLKLKSGPTTSTSQSKIQTTSASSRVSAVAHKGQRVSA